jgi:hypothetical protein
MSLADFVKAASRELANGGPPDFEWSDVLFLRRGEGIALVALVGLKHAQIQESLSNLVLPGTEEAVLLLNTWIVESRENVTHEEAIAVAQEWRGELGSHPNRVERLVAYHAYDRIVVDAWTASIERHEGAAPTLGDWQLAGPFGSIPDALRSALAR